MRKISHALTAGALALASTTGLAGMTATYTGSPFTGGQTQWGTVTFTVTFVDDFQPVPGQWSGNEAIQSYSTALTNGPSFSPQDHLFAEFKFNRLGYIEAWWLSVDHYPAVYTPYSGASFTTYRNGFDGAASWDFAILPGDGNAAWNYVSNGKWVQSALLPSAAIPEASAVAMVACGLLVVTSLRRRSGKPVP
jgi:hypothetical protein